MKYNQWQVALPCPAGQQELEEAGLPPLLAGLLAARGIVRPEEARRLLSPGSEPIPDPSLLKDMDRAARNLVEARRQAGRVLWLNPIPQRKWPYMASIQTMSGLCQMPRVQLWTSWRVRAGR